MPRHHILLAATTLLLATVAPALKAQGSPYIPLDDPSLPLFEHLVTRGDVSDPSPFVRPIRVADALRVLRKASDANPLIKRLIAHWAPVDSAAWWQVGARAGVQGEGAARRDPLQPAGSGKSAELFGEASAIGVFGPVVVASRVIGENRLKRDPDWTGDSEQQRPSLAYRVGEAYVAAQWGRVGLHLGTVDRNWGPVGTPALGVSNAGYPRPDLSLELRGRPISLNFLFAPLHTAIDSKGHYIQRYFGSHRLAILPSSKLAFGVWETMVLADEADPGTDVVGSLFSVMTFARQFGRAANNNSIVGLDAAWRARKGLQLEGQIAIDDYRLLKTKVAAGEYPRPNRYALFVGARGALARDMSWTAHYSRVSSLAYRTTNVMESYLDRGVGITRIVPDNDELAVTLSLPVASRVLLSPGLTYQRQGEGRMDTPFPQTAAELGPTPEFLIGTVRRTARAALGISGGVGPVSLRGDLGVNRVSNADQVAGRKRTEFQGRLGVVLDFHYAGRIQ